MICVAGYIHGAPPAGKHERYEAVSTFMTSNPIQLVRDMIAIPSVNPMRSDCAHAVENELVNYIENFFHRAGIDCERQQVAKGRDNLIAIVHSTANQSKNKGLMLNTHLDT